MAGSYGQQAVPDFWPPQPTHGRPRKPPLPSVVVAMTRLVQVLVRRAAPEKGATGPLVGVLTRGTRSTTVEVAAKAAVKEPLPRGEAVAMLLREPLMLKGEQPRKSGMLTLYWLQRAMSKAKAATPLLELPEGDGAVECTLLLFGAALLLQAAGQGINVWYALTDTFHVCNGTPCRSIRIVRKASLLQKVKTEVATTD